MRYTEVMGKKLYIAKKLDFHAPRGDRNRIAFALLLSSVALLLSDLLLLLQSLGVERFSLWLSVNIVTFVLLFVALAVLCKELCRNRFFSAVMVFIATLLITANGICVAVITR